MPSTLKTDIVRPFGVNVIRPHHFLQAKTRRVSLLLPTIC